MKTKTILTCVGMAIGCLSAAAAGAVKVEFVESERFTDFAHSSLSSRDAQAAYIAELTDFLEKKLAGELAPGQSLQVVITDVDMAGEFEPWRGGGFDDVRIVKDLYPPRIDLSFRVVDEAGNLVREGDRRLRNLNFMYALRPLDSDPLRHEKELLASWIRREFRSMAHI